MVAAACPRRLHRGNHFRAAHLARNAPPHDKPEAGILTRPGIAQRAARARCTAVALDTEILAHNPSAGAVGAPPVRGQGLSHPMHHLSR